MSEIFNFGIGLQIVGTEEASTQLVGIIDRVSTLTENVQAFNASTGMSAIASSADGLANSLVDIEDRMNAISAGGGAGGGAGGAPGGYAAVDPASLETFEEMRDILLDIGGILVELSGDTEKMSSASQLANEVLSDVSVDVAELADNYAMAGLSAQDMGNKVEKLEKKAVESADNMGESWEDANSHLGKFEKSVISLGHDLDDLANTILDAAIHPAFELERAAVRLGNTIGETSEFNTKFQKSVRDVSQELGFAESDVTALAQGLGEIGMANEALNKEKMTFLSNLQSNLGLTVGEIQAFAGAAKLMDASMEDMAASAMVFEKSFNVPGLVRQMPKIADTAVKAQARFGKGVVRSSRDAAVAVSRMAGVYAKALGKTAVESADDALEAFNKFAGESRALKNVFLGLSDDFTPLQMAFLETGIGLDEMKSLLRQAKTDQVGFVKQAKAMASSLDPFRRERFLEQLRQDLPEATAQLLNMTDAKLNDYAVEQKLANKEAERLARRDAQLKVLGDRFTSLRENVLDKFAKSSAKVDTIIKRLVNVFGGPLAASFDSLINYLDIFSAKLEAGEPFMEALIGKGTDLSKTLGDVGGGAMGFALAMGSVASAAGVAWKFLKPVWSIVKTVGGAVLSAAKSFGKLLGGFSKAATKSPGLGRALMRGFGKFLVIPGIIMAAIEPVQKFVERTEKILSGSGTGWEKFGEIVEEGLTAVGQTIDNFLGGLPSTFLEGFRTMNADISTTGAEEFGKTIGSFLGAGMEVITSWIQTVGLPALKEGFAALKTEKFWNSMYAGLEAVTNQVLAFFKGMGSGILEAFGFSAESITPVVEIAWIKIQKTFHVGFESLKDAFAGFEAKLNIMWLNMGAALSTSWERLTANMSCSWDKFVESVYAGMRGVVQFAIEHATAFGLPTDALDKAAQKMREMELARVRQRTAEQKRSEARIQEIETERKIEARRITDNQKNREKATDEKAAFYDSEIKARQQILNNLEEEKAKQETQNNLKELGVQAEQHRVVAETQQQRLAGEAVAALGKSLARRVAAGGAAPGLTPESTQIMLKRVGELVEQIKSMQDIDKADGTAAAAKRRAGEILVKLQATPGGADLMRRALTEAQIKSIDGNRS